MEIVDFIATTMSWELKNLIKVTDKIKVALTKCLIVTISVERC